MPYLTHEEYQLWGSSDVSAEDFPKLEAKASDVVDSVTRSFYAFNDINADVPFRRERFKKAVAAQIDYFVDNGTTSAHGLQAISNFSIGRTSVGKNQTSQDNGSNLVAEEVYMYLRDTGLLYRGVGTL